MASAAHQNSQPQPPREKLRFARGVWHRTNETLPRLRAGLPLGRDSTSLEGWMPRRVRLRLAPRPDTPSSETPPRSEARRPHERNSASLEALTAGSPLPRPEHLML
jgi:hypothetical protein